MRLSYREWFHFWTERKGLASSIWPSGEDVIGRLCSGFHPKGIFFHVTLLRARTPTLLLAVIMEPSPSKTQKIWGLGHLHQMHSIQGWKYATEPRGGTSVSPWRSSERVELHRGVHHYWIKAHPLGSD